MKKPALVILLASALPLLAPTFAWDQNPEPDIASYHLYVGTNSGSYQKSFVILGGATTNVSISQTNFFPGTNYFALTAVNSNGFESSFSAETNGVPPKGPGHFRFSLNLEQGPTPIGPWDTMTNLDFLSESTNTQFWRGRIIATAP